MAETATVFAFLNSAIKFSEVALKLCSVGSENAVFVRLILRVRNDLEEVERLISTPIVKKKLISTPGKLPWIKGVVFSTKSALNDIGQWVDRVRTDKEGYGSISFENRVRWVFKDHEKLTNRSLELSTNHQSLSNVLQYVMPLERDDSPQINNEREPSPPTYHDATYLDEIMPISSRQRRQVQYRKSQLDLRGSKEGGQREEFQQTPQRKNHLSPISQESFEEEYSSPSKNLASQDLKLRQAKSSISLAQSYQETPQITPRASFYNPSTAGLSSQLWENDSFSGTFNSISYVPKRPLSRQSTVSSLSTLNSKDTYDTPKPDTGQSNPPENPPSPSHWSFSPDRISPRKPAIWVEESQNPPRPQISGTNSIGPVNAYDMFVEMEPSSNPQKDNVYSASKQSLQVKQQSPQKDISELMSNFSLGQQKKRESFAELPEVNQFTNGTYNLTFPSPQELPGGYPVLPRNAITESTSTLHAPVELAYNNVGICRSALSQPITQAQPISNTVQESAFASTVPPTQLQGPNPPSQAQFQYSQYTNTHPHPQNATPFRLNSHSPCPAQHWEAPTPSQTPNQIRYQPYELPIQHQYSSPEISHSITTALPSPVGSPLYALSPTSYSDPNQWNRAPVSHGNPRELADLGYKPASHDNQHNQLSRSETLSETRRRNQKALLGLLK